MAVSSKRPRLNGIVNRIHLVGIELEGGWDEVPIGESIVKDGSVKFPPPSRQVVGRPTSFDAAMSFEDALRQGYRILPLPSSQVPALKGEIASEPMVVEQIAEWIRHAYPKYVNETCGLHVHMSFYYRSNYSRLMTQEFTPFIIGKVRDFALTENLPKDHPQWDRVNNPKHLHCAHLYLAAGQVKQKQKDWESRGKPHNRYTFVNYCDGQHRTIEVRGLSMMADADQAVRAVMVVLSGTNEFLSKTRHREKAERILVQPQADATRDFVSVIHQQ